MRFKLWYFEGDHLTKSKLDFVKSHYGSKVVIPLIDGEVVYLYLAEEVSGEDLVELGFIDTGRFEDESSVSRFLGELEFKFAVGDVVNIAGYGLLNWRIKDIKGERVVASPLLRSFDKEMEFACGEVLESKDGLEYKIEYPDCSEVLGIDAGYLEKCRVTGSIKQLFWFIVRLKLQLRGNKVVFFGGNSSLVSEFAESLNLPYLIEGTVPVAHVYFTDQVYLVMYADFLVQFVEGETVFYRQKSGCNELVKSAVQRLFDLGVISKEKVSSVTLRHLEEGREEELYRAFGEYRNLIDLGVKEFTSRTFEMVGRVEPVSMGEFLEFAKKHGLDEVVDSPDFYHVILYK
jgi:hypothetical protein